MLSSLVSSADSQSTSQLLLAFLYKAVQLTINFSLNIGICFVALITRHVSDFWLLPRCALFNLSLRTLVDHVVVASVPGSVINTLALDAWFFNYWLDWWIETESRSSICTSGYSVLLMGTFVSTSRVLPTSLMQLSGTFLAVFSNRIRSFYNWNSWNLPIECTLVSVIKCIYHLKKTNNTLHSLLADIVCGSLLNRRINIKQSYK